MPGPYIPDPTPRWLKAENASVTDSALTKALRMIGSLIGADNPTAQVMGLMMTEVPGGATGGLAKAVGKLKERAIRAYHGSPHDFEKFSMSKIGTGEGAQAYGHGLYFAENPAVAKQYRDNLTPQWLTDTNKRLSDLAETMEKDSVGGQYRQFRTPAGKQAAEEYDRLMQDRMDKIAAGYSDGKTYEVAIKADPDDFLDWDKPLSQQSEKARERLGPVLEAAAKRYEARGTETGIQSAASIRAGNVPVSSLMSSAHNQAIATDMKQAGIPGIKYLDQGSRAAGEGSRNYVVFDDQLIDILKKYGIAASTIEGLRQAAQANHGRIPQGQMEAVTQ